MAHDVREQTVESLSTELLSVILLNAVSMYKHEENPVNLHEQLESFERLRLVCHRWNNAIEADPCFWSSCGVTIPKNTDGLSQITSILHALENFFSRSGSLQLTLGIYWPFKQEMGFDGASPVVQFLASCSHRWKSLHFLHMSPSRWDWVPDPWWLFLFKPIGQLEGERSCSNVEELILDCADLTMGQIYGKYLRLSQVFPNVARLSIKLRYLSGADDLRDQLVSLRSLSSLKLAIDNADSQDIHRKECAVRLVFGTLAGLPQLEHFEPSLKDFEFIEHDFKGPTELFPSAPLTHRALTSLRIVDAAHLLLLSTITFPALQSLYVENTVRACNNYSNFQGLQKLLAETPQLRKLELMKVRLSTEELVTLLCSLSSLTSLQITPHSRHLRGTFLSQLVDQSKTKPVLPHLVSFTINLDSGWDCTRKAVLREMALGHALEAFQAFVEDPRRSGEDMTGSFETLRFAVVYDKIRDMEIYSCRE
ncbi:hypothetical protein BKA70DRAFT_1570062 [Coprinopsis sp. MPI-PUGE-AT-0042]|nr:hypothetical protein BKA70DRAFT_1570062 [Coprinopsis sp. MPI-PUGE-AT-0042]